MGTQTFLENFGAIANAPGGIDRLRDLILELAIRGQLSERRNTDSPISLDGLEPCDEVPFEVPPGWNWVALDSLGPSGERTIADGPFGSKLKSSHYVDQPGYRVIRLGNIGSGYFKDSDQSFVSAEHFEALSSYHLRSGDIVVASLGNPCGRACVVPDRALPALNKADCFRVRLGPAVSNSFATLALNAQTTLARAAGLNRGDTRGRINLSHLKATPIPLPPRAEQDRIVAKVQELMQLCDDLEARQQCCHDIAARTRESAVSALTAARHGDDLHAAWDRIVQNWNALVGDIDGVLAVQMAVQQLAVEGRLTSSDSSDGSATEFLERIQPGIAREDPVDPSRIPYELPATWKWVHLENVCTHIVDCLHKTPRYVEHGYPAIRTSDVEPGRILLDRAKRVDEATFKERTSRLPVLEGDVVYSREGGRFGIAATVPPGIELCLGQRMMQFRCCPGVDPDYFSLFLNSPLGFGQASADVGGSASPHVNIKAIRRFVLPLPPPAEQRRIVDRVLGLDAACRHLQTALARQDDVGYALAGSLAASVI